ncbi:MAG: prepilin peptidase [Deltaproteobacteria bacterium]
MIELLVTIIGLVIGSFLNVCIYRIPHGESIAFPPSHCTECGQRLAASDLIPVVSYVLLRGRCRYCKTNIPIRYPLVELLTGMVFLLLYIRYGLSLSFAFYAIMMATMIVVFFIDLDHLIIPDRLVVFASCLAGLTAIYNLFMPLTVYGDSIWWNPLLGALIGSGSLLIVAIIGSIIFRTDEAMGGGDIKLMIPIGLFLGWRLTIVTLFLAIIIAGLVGIFLLLLKKTSRGSSIPFGPFIVLATFIALMWGYQIIEWYLAIY